MNWFEMGIVFGSWVVMFYVGSDYGYNKKYDKERKKRDKELKELGFGNK